MVIKNVFLYNECGELKGPPGSFLVLSEHRNDFWDWCKENNYYVEYHGTLSIYDLWYIENTEHSSWAVLRWT